MLFRSSFTKDSELQNAETAAWGRAIVAVLASDTKEGIASREEVRNRQTEELSSRIEAAGTVDELRALWAQASPELQKRITARVEELNGAG